MSQLLQLRRGTTAQHATFTGAVGELTIDTDKDVPVVHDGTTAGGFPLAKAADAFLADGSTVMTGSLQLGATLGVIFEGTTADAFETTLVAGEPASSDKTIKLPYATDTLVGKATTDTLTNKRITLRRSNEASSATPTINTDNVDLHDITALATAMTSLTTNLTGTPTTGDVLFVRIKDNGTARALTFGASFASSGNVTLPTTTVVSTLLTLGFQWSGSVWTLVGKA